MNLFCIGMDYATSEVSQRETLAFSTPQIREVIGAVSEATGHGEAVILSTCNRTEFYISTPVDLPAALAGLKQYLRDLRKPNFDLDTALHLHEGIDCVRHLFEVASGLRSMVVGETEILGQTKDAYQLANEIGFTGKYLNKLFQTSFAAAKDARTMSGIGRGSISVASVAVELAEKILGDLSHNKALVLGAGETSERVVRTLVSKGVKTVIVSNRTHERAVALATEINGTAVHWEEWEPHLMDADMIISSTAAPHFVLRRAQMETVMPRRSFRPLFLIDLAIPRDIEPASSMLDSVYLYDLDDLQSISNQHLAERQQEVENCRRLLAYHQVRFSDWLEKAERMELEKKTVGHTSPTAQQQGS